MSRSRCPGKLVSTMRSLSSFSPSFAHPTCSLLELLELGFSSRRALGPPSVFMASSHTGSVSHTPPVDASANLCHPRRSSPFFSSSAAAMYIPSGSYAKPSQLDKLCRARPWRMTTILLVPKAAQNTDLLRSQRGVEGDSSYMSLLGFLLL